MEFANFTGHNPCRLGNWGGNCEIKRLILSLVFLILMSCIVFSCHGEDLVEKISNKTLKVGEKVPTWSFQIWANFERIKTRIYWELRRFSAEANFNVGFHNVILVCWMF